VFARAIEYEYAMHVRGLVWLGTRTEHYEATVAFAADVLGLSLTDREPGMAIFTLPDGGTFEVFAPEHEGGGYPPRGVVAGFLVGDPAPARQELAAFGCEVSELHVGQTMRWAYFRAPDGNLYEGLGA
jgi:catechol 2,3-dioxygenase-like lactoylglutathione lyase family enzyme